MLSLWWWTKVTKRNYCDRKSSVRFSLLFCTCYSNSL